MGGREPIDPQTLLSPDQIKERYGLSAFTLRRWVQLRRVPLHRVNLERGEVGSNWRFVAGDIVRAIEKSSFDEPGSNRRDEMY